MSDATKIWFVTGASSGFGRAMSEHLLAIGHKVVAVLRKPEALSDLTVRYPIARLLVVRADVTIKSEVTAAFAKAEEVFGRIDVVFNNAGVTITGEVESMEEVDARPIFDVNFWGAVHVTKEAVRFFREVNKPVGGRLLQVSSRLGLVGMPAVGYYSASKFALEGLTECLADELEPAWNIKVTIIEPGPFRTEILQKNYHAVPPHPAYTDPASRAARVRQQLAAAELFDGDAVKAVAVIERVSRLEDAPIRFPLHRRTVAAMKGKARSLQETAEKYESWSDDLYHDN